MVHARVAHDHTTHVQQAQEAQHRVAAPDITDHHAHHVAASSASRIRHHLTANKALRVQQSFRLQQMMLCALFH